MQQNLEIEVKALVKNDEFLKLCDHFKVSQVDFTIQTNYYFDTVNQDLLLKHKSSLRVRNKKDKYYLTLKLGLIDAINELEHEIDEDTFVKLINNNVSLAGYFDSIFETYKVNVNDIKYLSYLTTNRASFKYLDGELFLDVNHYNNQVDYEVEYETTSYEYGKKVLNELFNSLNIKFNQNEVSKRYRATKKSNI